LGSEDDPGLPMGQIDIVLMVHVLHLVIHDQNPFALLENIRTSLKPDGVLVLVQWDGKKMGYPEIDAYSQESILNVIEKSCFEVVRTEIFLPREVIFILRAK
jgi:SAM-dependent methyltransferase